MKLLFTNKSAIVFILFVGLSSIAPISYANMPVLDVSNLAQNTITAAKTAAAVEKQIQQYKLQLQQYQDMLNNSLTPSSYVWDNANDTINKLLQETDTLDYYKSQAGNLDNYLSRYQDTDYYQKSPCFTSEGCTAQQRQALMNTQTLDSEAQKRANDAMLMGIDQQQTALKNDSQNLASLQKQATTAQGRMEALQAANQLASAQTNQLLQIRALLVAQQNAQATRAQVLTDKEAKEAASAQQLRQGTFEKSANSNW
jgi:P-type conjugative transfer protein TrbJ